jgi:hypothetical protein
VDITVEQLDVDALVFLIRTAEVKEGKYVIGC